MATQQGWQSRLTRVVAGEVRRYRKERGMSAQQLADRCEQLGFAIPRPVLSNIENGRRESVTVAELVVLARVLGVEPTLLIAPVGRQPSMEIFPSQEALTWDAARWITGEAHLRDAPGLLEATADVDGDDPMFLFRRHDDLVEQWREIGPNEGVAVDGKVIKSAADLKRDAAKNLQFHRSLMRRSGLLPPPLPPDMAHLDDQEPARERPE